MTARTPVPEPRDPVERRVAGLLERGTMLVVAVVVLGSLLLALAGVTPVRQRGPGFDPRLLAAEVVGLRPSGVLWLGLLLTVALPTGRVLVSLLGFARVGDRRSVLTATAVLGILGLSLTLALTSG